MQGYLPTLLEDRWVAVTVVWFLIMAAFHALHPVINAESCPIWCTASHICIIRKESEGLDLVAGDAGLSTDIARRPVGSCYSSLVPHHGSVPRTAPRKDQEGTVTLDCAAHTMMITLASASKQHNSGWRLLSCLSIYLFHVMRRLHEPWLFFASSQK